MISFEEWDKAVDYSYDNWDKKRLRVTFTDGEEYIGICKGYTEEEDSRGDNVYAIICGMISFIQEQVEKIEFLD